MRERTATQSPPPAHGQQPACSTLPTRGGTVCYPTACFSCYSPTLQGSWLILDFIIILPRGQWKRPQWLGPRRPTGGEQLEKTPTSSPGSAHKPSCQSSLNHLTWALKSLLLQNRTLGFFFSVAATPNYLHYHHSDVIKEPGSCGHHFRIKIIETL